MPDGSSLAVSTISCTKLFRLRQKDHQLLVSKIVIPISIGEAGARTVKFSPDGKWLLLIRSDSKIQICRLKRDEGARKGLLILPRLVTLGRLPRDTTETQSELGLGSYMRTISRVAFSADSRILAVGDLAGYLDTWILQGSEDFTEESNKQQPALEQDNRSDDESSDEEVHAQVVTLGQSWIRNPAASILPKLPSAALILSFRPRRPNHDKQATSGISLNAKGKSSHSKSASDTEQEDRLFVFTGEHQIYEFHVLSGKLSAWSRRNPSSQLPQAFQTIRDRAMGSIWDVCGLKERIWLYGSSWLWMFDLSLDFPTNLDRRNQNTHGELMPSELSTKNLKRKRGLGDRNSEEVGRRNTGAGDKIPESELYVGIGRKFRKTNGPDSEKGRWINADIERCQSSGGDDDEADEDDNDDEDAANESALLGLRRGLADAARITNGLTNDEASGIVQLESRESDSCRPYWGTHRYRDILGIVPLGDVPENGDDLRRSIEVALIERPLHEVDLPPRYHGDQEWD